MTAQQIEAKANVRWWPSSLVDEDMPVGLATPTHWLFNKDGDTALLGVDEPGWDEAWVWELVTAGDVIEFVAAEYLGTFKMTIASYERWRLDRQPPPGVTHWYPDDPEEVFETPQGLASHLVKKRGHGVFEVEAFRWGEDVAHRLEMGPEGLRFVRVEVAP